MELLLALRAWVARSKGTSSRTGSPTHVTFPPPLCPSYLTLRTVLAVAFPKHGGWKSECLTLLSCGECFSGELLNPFLPPTPSKRISSGFSGSRIQNLIIYLVSALRFSRKTSNYYSNVTTPHTRCRKALYHRSSLWNGKALEARCKIAPCKPVGVGQQSSTPGGRSTLPQSPSAIISPLIWLPSLSLAQ